jgi:Fur family iron response transcriptional regulator
MNMKHKQFSTEEIEKKLVEKGVQATLQRIAICKYVLSESDHPTADDVFEWAQKHLAKISQATVYNTLGTLADAGILRTFKFPHSEKVVYDCNTEDHFHFFDEKSGKLVDIEPESIKINLDLPKKFKVKAMDLVIKGEIK